MTAVRTLVVWCPDWPVVAAGVPLDQPAATFLANRVVACSPAARADGVVRHMRRREAQGRCPELVVIEHDPARDARTFEPVVAALEALTPRIEITHPGQCAFVTRGPSRYFGGDDALAARAGALVAQVLDGRGGCRVGIADGPFAAAHAARRGAVVAAGESRAFLAPLPLVALDRPELTDVLDRLGLVALGDLAALPAADVLARFGTDGHLAHRLASGMDERPPATTPPPPDLVVSAELDPPAERVETAAFLARNLAEDLHERLASRGAACTRLLIGAETEHGETLERLWRHEGALSAGAIADRARWQLDGWLTGSALHRPTAGISKLWLAPDEVVPATGRQLGFWGADAARSDRAVRAVARVQGLLGTEAVVVPEWRGGRTPIERIGMVSAAAVDLEGDRPAAHAGWIDSPWPGAIPLPSPAAIHTEPLLAQVLDEAGRPVGVGGRGLPTAPPARLAVAGGPGLPIRAWAGPWPVEERWWDPPAARRCARFQVLTADGVARLVTLERGRWWVEATYD
jgi:protein ImuB